MKFEAVAGYSGRRDSRSTAILIAGSALALFLVSLPCKPMGAAFCQTGVSSNPDAAGSVQPVIPSSFDSWQSGCFTVVETRVSTKKTSTVTRVRTEVTGRTHDTLDTVVTTDSTNTMDISGRQVTTESHVVVESSMNFSTQTASVTTTSTVDGVTTGPFEAEGPIEVHKLVQIPGLVRWAKPTRTEKIMKRGKPIECDVYEVEGNEGKASIVLSKSIPIGGPLGGLLKSSSPYHETILLDFGTGEADETKKKR